MTHRLSQESYCKLHLGCCTSIYLEGMKTPVALSAKVQIQNITNKGADHQAAPLSSSKFYAKQSGGVNQ